MFSSAVRTGSAPSGLRRLMTAGLLTAVAATGFATLAPAQASAASSVDGPITRSEVLARAQYWVDKHVPYSQSVYSPDPQGRGYRSDCSGYVSMAWHLGTSLVTQTLPQVSTQISYDDLLPGDALDKESEHVVLFDHWVDGAHTLAQVYTEPDFGQFAMHENWTRATLLADGYHAYRYNKIVNDVAQPQPLQIGAVTGNGGLFHTIRNTDGTWAGGFGDVDTEAGPLDIVAADGALTGGDMQIVAVSRDGKLHHTARLANGHWLPWGDVNAQTGAGFTAADVAVAAVDNELNVVVTDTDGNVWHAIRHLDETWTHFGNVNVEAGTADGKAVKVSAAAVHSPSGSDTDLHVAVTNADGKVWHTGRKHQDGTWLPFGDVEVQAGPLAKVADIAIAGTGVDLQMLAVTTDGKVFHTGRKSDGTWLPFGDVIAATGTPLSSNAVTIDAAGEPNGDLHVVIGTADGKVVHTARKTDATWLPFGDVESQTSNPGAIVNVTAA